jgi:hypothetical protein
VTTCMGCGKQSAREVFDYKREDEDPWMLCDECAVEWAKWQAELTEEWGEEDTSR